MSKPLTSRAVFPIGEQATFLNHILLQALTSRDTLAGIVGVHTRTYRDWCREKHAMSWEAAQLLSQKYGVPLPKEAHEQAAYAHTKEAGKKGGAAIIQKYGVVCRPEFEEKREIAWKKWWDKGEHSLFKSHAEAKMITLPARSEKLAEFIGIVLGDGTIAKYQVVISLNYRNESNYAMFVATLIRELFDTDVVIYQREEQGVYNVTISRSALVQYLASEGLPIGDKIRQGADIPKWIMENPAYAKACLRGLVDTDGCVFDHRYMSAGKLYSYKKLCYTSYGQPLRHSAFTIMKNLGLHPRLYKHRDVRLDRTADVVKYFQVVGTSNPKNLSRYQKGYY